MSSGFGSALRNWQRNLCKLQWDHRCQSRFDTVRNMQSFRWIWLATVIFCLFNVFTFGQSQERFFRLPEKAAAKDYVHGYVLAKLKPTHRNLFRQANGRTASGIPAKIGARSTREMMPAKAVNQGRLNKGPRRQQSSIDPGLYYELACEPGRNIEDFINDLYQTGFFEVVEPDYVNQMVFTPNDPSQSSQYYLQNIRAYEAWDITKGDEGVTIAIVDSGGDLDHPDLAGVIASNPLDPPNGIDDDGNGYIDDYRGWDFMGTDTLNITDPDFLGDNDPQLFSGGLLGHGVNVAGCASAGTDNGTGISGIGFKTKIMFTKHSADNQKITSGSIYRGYSGILYAGIRGAEIINCSWGGSFRSEIVQDLINFVTLDLGSLVVAAAGNDGLNAPFYPAAYDNVLSVSAIDQQNIRASFTNSGPTVDIAAPGVAIFTTAFNDSYTITQGTSFSSPIVAGAAALVKAHFPAYSPQQVAEQLRVTANATKLYSANPSQVGKLGKGVLDIFAALTQFSPSLRLSNPKLVNAIGSPVSAGEKGFLTFSFTNILAETTSALEITITESSPNVEILKGTIRPGIIPTGGVITNKLTPFEIQIGSSVPINLQVPITITYKDGAYVDQQVVNFILNPSFIDVDENQVTTTISSTGRIGYEDTESATRTKGSGFAFDGNSLLYEMGIIMGSGTGAQLYNNVRSTSSSFDQDFVSIGSKIKEIIPGDRSTSEIFGTISNSSTPGSQGFQLKYRSLAWKEDPYDQFVILEYIISNPTASPITNFHFGLFADWDITESGGEDAANWENDLKLGYVFPAQTAAKPHAGIQLLTGAPEYYAIDNNQAIAGGTSFGIYDGFTDNEKFQAISSGLGRLQAGVTGSGGNDVSHVVSSGPYTIPAGQQITIAFALHGAPNLDDLRRSAKYADSVYNYTLNAPQPAVAEVSICYGGTASSTATGATDYKWYKTFTGGTSFFTGSTFNTGILLNDTTFYVSNAENFYESIRTPAKVNVRANPTISSSGSSVICSNGSITLSVADADTYLWSTGETTKTIQVSSAGTYSITVESTSPACQSTSAPITTSVVLAPFSDFSIGGELKSFSPIQFTDESTDAVSWEWDFGNGTTSIEQNPAINFMQGQLYEIELTVTSAQGCQHSSTQAIDVITGLEVATAESLEVYPNPFSSSVFVSFDGGFAGPKSIQLLTLQGREVFHEEGIIGSRLEIPIPDQLPGIYVLRVAGMNGVVTLKVVKIR